MIPQSSEPERRCVDPIASQSSLLSSDDASTSDFSEVSNSSAYEGDLERRLSGTTVRQLLRIKDDGYEHQLEQDYAAALEELERKSAYNAALYQAVIGLKRDRKACDVHVNRLEDELASVRKECEQRCAPVQLSYRQAQAALERETKALEKFRIQSADDCVDLRSRLSRLEADITILKNKFEGSAKDKDEVNGILNSIHTWAGDVDQRLASMEEDCARLQIFVEKELQTRLDRAPYELEFPTLPNDSSSQNSPLTTASPPSSQQSSLAEEASYDALSDVSIPSSAHAMKAGAQLTSQSPTSSKGVTSVPSSRAFPNAVYASKAVGTSHPASGSSRADLVKLAMILVLIRYVTVLKVSTTHARVNPEGGQKQMYAKLRKFGTRLVPDSLPPLLIYLCLVACLVAYFFLHLVFWRGPARAGVTALDAESEHPFWEMALRHTRDKAAARVRREICL